MAEDEDIPRRLGVVMIAAGAVIALGLVALTLIQREGPEPLHPGEREFDRRSVIQPPIQDQFNLDSLRPRPTGEEWRVVRPRPQWPAGEGGGEAAPADGAAAPTETGGSADPPPPTTQP